MDQKFLMERLNEANGKAVKKCKRKFYFHMPD